MESAAIHFTSSVALKRSLLCKASKHFVVILLCMLIHRELCYPVVDFMQLFVLVVVRHLESVFCAV